MRYTQYQNLYYSFSLRWLLVGKNCQSDLWMFLFYLTLYSGDFDFSMEKSCKPKHWLMINQPCQSENPAGKPIFIAALHTNVASLGFNWSKFSLWKRNAVARIKFLLGLVKWSISVLWQSRGIFFQSLFIIVQAFFVCVFAKTQGKKTQAPKKTQGFSGAKLNVPVLSNNFPCKNSSFCYKNSRIVFRIE